MNRVFAVACLLLSACGEHVPQSEPVVFEGPFDPLSGTSSVLIHRPLPVGTRLRVQGLFSSHRRVTAKNTGYVVHQETQDLQLAYDVAKTFVEVDPDGYPTRVRYDVASVASTDADIPPIAALSEGHPVRLKAPGSERVNTSGGQAFEFEWAEGHPKVSMLNGRLSEVEQAALTDPLGPAYELWLEAQLAYLFGPKKPQRPGATWDIDVERAREFLQATTTIQAPIQVTGKASFASLDKIGPIRVQRIEGWVVGEGGLRTEVTKKIHVSRDRVEVKYSGLFPVDLALPPVEHDWHFKAAGVLVVEVNNILGEVHLDTSSEHLTRIVEVSR